MLFEREISFAPTKEAGRVELGKLKAEFFEIPTIWKGDPDNKDGEIIYGAKFKNNRRLEENLIAHTVITLDFDKVSLSEFEAAKQLLNSRGIEYLYHTTTRHTLENPRFRLILDISRELEPFEYAPLVRRIASKLPIETVDSSSFVNNQGMFLPLVLPDTRHYYEWGHNVGMPIDVQKHVDALKAEDFDFSEKEVEEVTDEILPIPDGLTEAEWISAICISNKAKNCDYDQWAAMGMALHHQTNGKGYGTWLKWSEQNDTIRDDGSLVHNAAEMPTKWKSFKLRDGQKRGKTIRSILNAEGGKVLTRAYTYAMLHLVEDQTSYEKFCNHISNDKFVKDKQRAQISRAIKKTHEKVSDGETITSEEAMEKIQVALSDDEKAWAKSWYLNTQDEKMYNSHTGANISKASFDAKFTRLMPMNVSGSRHKAYDVMIKAMYGYEMKIVDDIQYLPGQSKIVTQNGMQILNSFSESNWPEAGYDFSSVSNIDAEIKECIDIHTLLLAGGREDVQRYIQQHIGHLRQHPSQRIRKGLCITSVLTGVGKSVLKMVYKTVLGPNNISNANNTDLTDTYNGFVSRPVLVTFFEEISLNGKELYYAMEKMKELITEDRVTVRRMYSDTTPMNVSTCFVMFSNYPGILGEQGSGRRWTPIDIPYRDHKEIEEKVITTGETVKEFYKRYIHLMERYPSRFVSYFENVDLTGFDRNVPHETEEKEIYMVREKRHLVSDVVEGIIEEAENKLVTENMIAYPALVKSINAMLSFDNGENEALTPLHNSKNFYKEKLIAEALDLLGYRSVSFDRKKRITLQDGNRYRYSQIYLRNDYTLKDLIDSMSNGKRVIEI